MKIFTKKHLSIFLCLIMLFTAVTPAVSADDANTGNTTQTKFTKIEPTLFNPKAGETATIKWNFEKNHNASVIVYQGSAEGNIVKTIYSSKFYTGNYAVHEETWDGTDDNGQVVQNGLYTIVIEPLDEWEDWPSTACVTVSTSSGKDIDISPNLEGDNFVVSGSADDRTTGVVVDFNGESIDAELQVDEDTGSGIWFAEVNITEDYEIQTIEAVKTWEEEVPDGVDEAGNPITKIEVHEDSLGPIRVLKHMVRPFDTFGKMAAYYYENDKEYTKIIEKNKLSAPYLVRIGSRLLVPEPEKGGEPPKAQEYDPNDMTLMTGFIDMMDYSVDPVNLSTGNFIYNHSDIQVDGGFPVAFGRFYNSQDGYLGVIGHNWHHSFETRLQELEDGSVDILFSDGRREHFTSEGSGRYRTVPGRYGELVKNGDLTFTFTAEDKIKYFFNERGQLTGIEDLNGNMTRLIYEDLLLSEVRNNSGYLLFQYDDNAMIRKISDAAGRHVEYGYIDNNLTSFTDAEGNTINYQYDNGDRLVKIVDPLNVESIENEYDDENRTVRQVFPDGTEMLYQYDDEERTTTLTERNGSIIIYKYDEKYRITEKTYLDGTEKFTFDENDNRKTFTDRKGKTYSYEYDNRGNIIQIKDPLGGITAYTYDQYNKVTSITDPEGNVTQYKYDDKGNLKESTDPLGRKLEFEYNAKGLPVRMVQPDGSIFTMEYDSRGNITTMTDPLGSKTKYEYDSINRIKAVTQPNGSKATFDYTENSKIKKVTDAYGNTVSYTYNAKGKPIAIKDKNGNTTKLEYNNMNQLSKVTDPLGHVTKYEYDAMWNKSKITDAEGGVTAYKYDALNRLESITDAENNTTYYQYDPNGNVTKITDPKGNETRYSYDELNRLIEITDAKLQTTKYQYDPAGRIRKIIDALDNATEYQYDEAGQVTEVKDVMGNTTKYTYNALGLIETITDANGSVTSYEYNALGEITKLSDAEGAVTQWQYDGNGNIIKIIDALGEETDYAYDKLNRVIKITNAMGNSKNIEYNKLDQVTAVTDEKGNRTEYKYDALGQLKEVEDAVGNSTKYVYNAVGLLTEMHRYRALDSDAIEAFTVCEKTVTESVYKDSQLTDGKELNTDLLQMQVQELDIVLQQKIELQTVVEQVYGQELSVTQAVYGLGAFAEDQATYFSYDNRGLLTHVTDAAGKVTVYNYDANGNLTSAKDRDGYTTNYEYDPLNLVTKIKYSGSKQVSFEYNELGQLIQMHDWLGTTSLELDPLGRIQKVTDFDDRVTEYIWGPMGEKQSIKYPDGSEVTYTYDKLGRMTGVTDAAGEMTQYKYNGLGSLIERELPNGSSTQYEYDALSQLTQLAQINPAGQTTDIYEYDYDAAGNKIKAVINRTELENDDTAEEQDEDGETDESFTYKYSPLNQLIEVSKNNEETRKYFYDTVGNRVRQEEYNADGIKEAVNYQYDKLDRLVRTFEDTAVNEDNNQQYIYDNRGNLVQTKSGDNIFNDYYYDETNRLVEVVNKHNDITSYIYDGFGNRVAQYIDLDTNAGGDRPGNGHGKGHAYGHDKDKHGNGKAIGHGNDNGNPHPGWSQQYKRDSMEIKYVLDITIPYDNVLMMYGDNYQVQRYTRGIDTISVDQWELENPNNGWIPDTTGTNLEGDPDRLYYLQNEMGSITKVIGEDGKTSAHYNYDEFGRPLSFRKFDQNWPGPDNTFGYTGYQYDVYAGLWYAQARYYDPIVGRFISEDSYKGDTADPLSLNLYTYCYNNPVKYVDPDGNLAFPGEIHAQVLKQIVSKNITLSKERWLSYPGKGNYGEDTFLLGRVDLVDLKTGYIWELKPENWDRGAAIAQLMNYEKGEFLNKNLKKLDIEIYNGTGEEYNLSGCFEYDMYDVHYWYSGEGILNYSYTVNLKRYLKEAAAAKTAEAAITLALIIKVLLGEGIRVPAPGF